MRSTKDEFTPKVEEFQQSISKLTLFKIKSKAKDKAYLKDKASAVTG